MYTTMLIQRIEHSYIYTNLNWQNNTQAFSTNPCFLKNAVYDVSDDTLTHPQKTWIRQKNFILSDGIIELVYTNFASFFFPRETRNVSLVGLIQICEAKYKMQTNVTNIAANSYPSLSTYSAG